MSTREWGFDVYALVLSPKDMKKIAKALDPDFSEKDFEEDPWGFYEIVYDRTYIDYMSQFTGDAFFIRDDGTDDGRSPMDTTETDSSYYDDEIFYLPFRNSPSLFSAAYRDMSGIIQEVKGEVGKYLGRNFNYAGNIRHIVGTYWG